MRKDRLQRILEAYKRWGEDEPDISTEQLFARVCDECDCDAGDVAEALHSTLSQPEDVP